MSIVEQIEAMLKEQEPHMNIPIDMLKQFEDLVASGAIHRRVYDIPPVNVFGSRDALPLQINASNIKAISSTSRGGGIRISR